MSDGRITFALDGQVARITLDRPGKLNALTPAMLTALGDAVGRIDGDDDIRVVVLSATGHRAFCVGADIDAWAANGPLDMWRHWVRDGHAVFDRMARLRPPLIAAIEGLALGGGLELAATCDLRIGGAGAVFGLPEADVGVVPGWSGTQRLVRQIGPAPVKLMALAGERPFLRSVRRPAREFEHLPGFGRLVARVRAVHYGTHTERFCPMGGNPRPSRRAVGSPRV